VLVLVLAGALVASAPARAQGDTDTDTGTELIGTSQAGAPLVVHHLGTGATRVFILGGQHGGPEANTVQLVERLLDHFAANPNELPDSVELDILPVANPDGLANGTRQLLSGVDPNRNWGGPDWRADAYDSNAHFRVGLGGPEPFSEPETRALADWLLRVRPALVVNYHSAGGFVFGPHSGPTADLAAGFVSATGYRWPEPGSGQNPLPYTATGSMSVWLREVGIPGLFVELSSAQDPELARNLAGVQAVLEQLASTPQ